MKENQNKINFKKIFIFVLGIMILLSPFSVFSKNYNKDNHKKIIVIDPGHGGRDGGAVSSQGILEKDVNLSICNHLKRILLDSSYEVIMTREDDVSLHGDAKSGTRKKADLENRIKIKNESNCDAFISIHLNSFKEDSKCNGTQIWHGNNEKSQKLAAIIKNNVDTDLNPDKKREIKAAEKMRVLRDGDMAQVIIECGFLSNEEDVKKLISDDYQIKLCKIIEKSLNTYFDE